MTAHVMHPMASPDGYPALVPNAGFRPLSYYTLSLWSWRDAIKAVFKDRVDTISQYDTVVRRPSFDIRLPSVVSRKSDIKPSRTPAFIRFNVFPRDRFACQDCNMREEPTFDRVIPRSKGGLTTWSSADAAGAILFQLYQDLRRNTYRATASCNVIRRNVAEMTRWLSARPTVGWRMIEEGA